MPISDPVKWQSKLFPKLILTETHYQFMRKAYPYIDSFRDEMVNLEAHLFANESKVPKSHWKAKVNNWMMWANKIAKERREKRLVKGYERPTTHREAAESVGEIFKRIAEETKS